MNQSGDSAAYDALFVCLHGSAKSVIAAAHLRALAAARDITLDCASAGIEPDADIPAHVLAGLAADGLGAPTICPARVTPDMIASARIVVSFGCELRELGDSPSVRRWDDIPPVSDGYAAARDMIVARLPALLDDIAAAAGRRESSTS